jgi:serine protease Do
MKRHVFSHVGISVALMFFGACCSLAVSPNIAREVGNAFADAVERVMPSVVVVRAKATMYRATPLDLFYWEISPIPDRLAGQGSGVIISRDGYVLTSNHVIQNAEKVEVVLYDETKYPAELVGRDLMSDVAVLKIRAPAGISFTAIEPGDSDKIRVGEFAIAVGSPFSLNSSVTVGIVSQKGRSVGLLPYDFIQTDASINPGNSGGPLTDVDGRMIGINAIIQTGGPYSKGNIGIGFAVPANLAMWVAESLIRSGKVDRPWLGLNLHSLDKTNDVDAGVMVGQVFRDTPAIRCGLAQGDIIVKIDDQPIYETLDVRRLVFKHRIGDIVKLEVRRDGKTILFEIVTERMPEIGQTMP